MMRRGVALCVLLVLTLAGCTTGDSTDGASAGGTQAPDLAAPERPADQRTEAGAISFAGYVFEVLQFAYGTADPAPLEDIADLELCFGCMQPLETIAAAASSGDQLVSDAEVSTSDAQVVDETGARTTVRLRVEFPELGSSGSAGETVPASDGPMLVTLRWDATQWTLVDFAPIGN
ncbi:DUF6318 family protein [Aeromicrobium sp. CF3.5]|uniref:DUF6318 family protein n=1 Tax=Aeromicrobium sp. CF3.5 TaxID=3373078 RepID=UPI003EE5469F